MLQKLANGDQFFAINFQRLLLNLAFFDGLSCPEIANYIGATEETVERAIRSALMGISLNFVSYPK